MHLGVVIVNLLKNLSKLWHRNIKIMMCISLK